MVRIWAFTAVAQIQSLVGALRSCKLHDGQKIKINNKKQPLKKYFYYSRYYMYGRVIQHKHFFKIANINILTANVWDT